MAADWIPSLIKMLEIAPQTKLESTMGFDVPILGQKRLQISQLLCDIIQLEIDELKDILVPAYVALFNLFNEFRENSFLHYIFETIFRTLLKPVKQDDLEKTNGIWNTFAYRLKVLKETKLLDTIAIQSSEMGKFMCTSSWL